MHRLTAVMLACVLPLAARGAQPTGADPAGRAWVERSNTYTNTLLEVEFAHRPERGSRQGLLHALVAFLRSRGVDFGQRRFELVSPRPLIGERRLRDALVVTREALARAALRPVCELHL